MIPKISCLCITHHKAKPLERAIACFKAQTYANKELFILYEDEDEIALNTLEQYKNDKDIKIYKESINPKKTLGELRNIAIGKCNGSFFCQWDDDDWHSSNRLKEEFLALKGNTNIILDQWFIYDATSKKAYLSNLRHWEGSILCQKDDKKLMYYSNEKKGEDTYLIDNLIKRDELKSLSAPYLYIYCYDGKNTWDKTHWNDIFANSTELDSWTSKDIQHMMEEKYDIDEASYRLKQLYENLTAFS